MQSRLRRKDTPTVNNNGVLNPRKGPQDCDYVFKKKSALRARGVSLISVPL